MPATYEPIATVTASGSISSVTFSSIAATYTDLVIIVNASVGTASNNLDIRLNGDTSSNYSYTQLGGSGTSALSTRATSQTAGRLDYYGYIDTGSYTNIINVMNYSNSTTYKTIISRSGNAGNGVSAVVNLWRNTAAVTSITLIGGTFTSSSTFTLYGIRSA